MAAVTRRLWAAWRHVAAPAITGAVAGAAAAGRAGARPGPGADRAAGANPLGGRAGGDADRVEGRAGVLPRQEARRHPPGGPGHGRRALLPVRLAALRQRRPVHVAAAPRPRP